MPILSARGFCPPAMAHARLRPLFVMAPEYPFLGYTQPKSLCITGNRELGSLKSMRDVDKEAFGKRVARRRELLDLSQGQLADMVGMKQQGIDNIEQGVVKRPRLLKEIATALRTSEEWLLWEEGSEEVGNVVGVKGLVGAGGTVDTGTEQIPPDGNLYEIEVPFALPPGAFALQVSGESMFPRYDSGDVIVCAKQSDDPAQLIGWESAVQTLDGSRYLKRLLRGSRKGLFDLESFNANPIRGVRLQWASPIHGVVRYGQWRLLSSRGQERLLRRVRVG